MGGILSREVGGVSQLGRSVASGFGAGWGRGALASQRDGVQMRWRLLGHGRHDGGHANEVLVEGGKKGRGRELGSAVLWSYKVKKEAEREKEGREDWGAWTTRGPEGTRSSDLGNLTTLSDGRLVARSCWCFR